jgi:hypothetical protein
VRDAFDRIISQGYEPQVLEAYNRFHKLIHPDNVQAALAGAIVLVYCTLEKAIFTTREGRKLEQEWQFYANLTKLQVLKQATPAKSLIPAKRKLAHGYGSDDPSGSNGSTSRKAVKFMAPVR